MSMDSFTKTQGVPVSAAQLSPKASLLSSSSGSSSFPIRAPLTIDSDSDVGSYGSDNGFESDGFLSNDVKFDNVLEKPVVATLDDESSGDGESVGTKPFVTNLNGEISVESSGSSNVEKKDVLRPIVTPPDEKASEEKESGSGSSSSMERKGISGISVSIPDRIITMKRVVSRRFLAVNGESLASPLVEDEGGKYISGATKMVDDILLSLPSPGIQLLATTPLVKEEDGKGIGADKEFVVSKPFVANPNEKNNKEKESSSRPSGSSSSNVEKRVVSGPYLSIPDKIITLNRVVSRRSLVVDGESLASPLVKEEDGKDAGGKTILADDINLSLASPGITPIAKLSEDSGKNSVGSVIEEDDGISGVARIQVLETLEKLSTRKDQVFRVAEGNINEDESQFKSVLESEVSEGLVSSEHLNGVLGGDEDMSIVKSDSLQDDNVDDLVKEEGTHIGGDAKATSVVESEASFMSGSSAMDDIAEYSVEEIHGLENMEQVAKLYNSIDIVHDVSVVFTSTTEGEAAVYSIKSKEVVEGGQTEDAGIDESNSGTYFPVDTSLLETDKVVDSTVEFEIADMAELGPKVVKTLEEKNVSETQGEDFHNPGGKCDIKVTVIKENAEADQDVNVNAIFVHDLKCETNGTHANESGIFSQSKCDEVEIIMEQDTDFSDGQIPSCDSGLMEDELCCKSTIHQPGSLGSDSDRLEVINKNERAHNCSKTINEHFVTYSDEDSDLTEESGKEVLFDSASFLGLPIVARGSENVNSVAITSPDDSGLLSLENSAELNSSISSLESTSQTDHLILSTSTVINHGKILAEEEIKKLDVQQIRLKYLRLVQRLGLSAESSVAAQALFWLDHAIGRSSSPGVSQETAKWEAVEFKAIDKEDMDFSLIILIIGKSGVGKSATINSIFGEEKTIIDPFEPATTAVKEIVGTIDGIKVRVLDTPGLGTSLKDQSLNKKILKSIRKYMKKCPPDVVIYVDRLDMQSQEDNDLPLLRSITSSLGLSLWHKTFITLTHAASTPPDGPSGEPLSYEKFVALRSHAIQQLISHAIGEQNMINEGAVNPVCLVENQGMCKKSRDGPVLFPNGEAWKPQLLLLCYSVKILTKLKSTIKAYRTLDVNKLFDFLVPSSPIPQLLSSQLQSCGLLKFSADQCEEEITFGKRLVLVGQNTKLVMRAGLSKNSELSVRISSSEQLHIPLVVLLSIVRSIFSKLFPVGKDY